MRSCEEDEPGCVAALQPTFFTRAASREILFDAVRLWNTPLCAARINSGCAALSAVCAAAASPEAIASSTLRTKVRTRLLRFLLISARRKAWRAQDGALGVHVVGRSRAARQRHLADHQSVLAELLDQALAGRSRIAPIFGHRVHLGI